MKIFKLTYIAAALFAVNVANADSDGGLFVEPAITYETGSAEFSTPIGSTDSDVNGFGLGGRLGFHVSEAFFLGLDARYSMPKFDNSDLGYNESSKAYNWGPVIGMQMPDFGLRVWGSYIAGGELDPEGANALDVRFKDSKGFRVGAGFRIAAVSLNLEYQELTYDTVDIQNLGGFAPGDFSGADLENKTWLASVSFPIQL